MHSLSAQHCQPHCANPKMARTWSHMSSAALGPRTFGTPSKPEITETFETVRTHQNPSKPRTPNLLNRGTHRNPEPLKPSKKRQLSKPGERNLWNLEPSQDLTHRKPEPVPGTTLGPRNLSEPIEAWNRFPEPVPGTRFLPRTAPARLEHTEIYIVQRPHSILLLGSKII